MTRDDIERMAARDRVRDAAEGVTPEMALRLEEAYARGRRDALLWAERRLAGVTVDYERRGLKYVQGWLAALGQAQLILIDEARAAARSLTELRKP